MSSPSLSILFLVGGEGRRLGGVTKALLKNPQGQTLLQHSLQTHQALDAQNYLLVSSSLAPAFADYSLPQLIDGQQGPAQALLGAAQQLSTEQLLVLAGDLVCPSLDLAKRLLEALSGYQAAVVRHENYLQPLVAAYQRQALADLAPEFEQRSMMKLLSRLEVCEIDSSQLTSAERAGLEDVDEPEDLVRHRLQP